MAHKFRLGLREQHTCVSRHAPCSKRRTQTAHQSCLPTLRLHSSKVLVELFHRLACETGSRVARTASGSTQRPANRTITTAHQSCPPMLRLHRSKVLIELFHRLACETVARLRDGVTRCPNRKRFDAEPCPPEASFRFATPLRNSHLGRHITHFPPEAVRTALSHPHPRRERSPNKNRKKLKGVNI